MISESNVEHRLCVQIALGKGILWLDVYHSSAVNPGSDYFLEPFKALSKLLSGFANIR